MIDNSLKYTLIILWVYIIINVLSFSAYGIDKRYAVKGKWRIKEHTLLLFSVFFGAVGGLCGMYFFHHKTKKRYFIAVNFVSCAAQLALLYFCLTGLNSALL